MQNRGHVDLANGGQLQLICEVWVDDGAGGARIYQEAKRTGSIHLGIDNHQVAVAQLELDCLFGLLSLGRKGGGEDKAKNEESTSQRESTAGKEATAGVASTALRTTTSIGRENGRQHPNLLIG